MYNTAQFDLPLLQASQAQKHITVNEALAKLDAVCQLRFSSRNVSVPPTSSIEGETFLLPVGSTGAWSSQDGNVAMVTNGGWTFLAPKVGWLAYIVDEELYVRFDGYNWLPVFGRVMSPGGAITEEKILEFEHSITAGASNTTSVVIPANTLVQAVTARIVTSIDAGSAASWRIGVSGSDDRYGSGLGLVSGSYAMGLTGSPQAYYSDTGILLTAEGDDFVSGSLKICVHFTQYTPPA